MSDKATKRIEELEARIRALEARPHTQIHYHYSPLPAPCHQPLPYWQQPWIAPQPIWAVSNNTGAAVPPVNVLCQRITTAGAAEVPNLWIYEGAAQ